MPVKIGFQVILSTGEDEAFKASELNHHSPTVRGWRSSPNCSFPQEIIIQLEELAVLYQIQILAHQYIIPRKIEICTSGVMDCASLSEDSTPSFEYLGFITFSDNRETKFRSRELKSISIPSRKAKYVKLRIHSNHANAKNALNQVALVAVNVLGDVVEDERSNDVRHRSINPTGSRNSDQVSPYDDLVFEMSVDRETARIIKLLEMRKCQAVCEERFDYANRLKITLENLRVAGETLGLYEQEKKQAINLEDYDKAKAKKLQIDNYRRKVYAALQVHLLLNSNEFSEEWDQEDKIALLSLERETSPRLSPYRITINGSSISALDDCSDNPHPTRTMHITSRTALLNHLNQSKSLTDTSENPVGPGFYVFSPSVSSPRLRRYLRQVRLRERESFKAEDSDGNEENSGTSSAESSSSAYESLPCKTLFRPRETDSEHKWNNLSRNTKIPVRAIEPVNVSKNRCYSVSPQNQTDHFNGANVLKSSASDYRIRGRNETSVMKSSFEAYEDKMLPALRSYHGNEVVRECQLVLDQPRKSTLNEREKKQAMLPISVFGIDMIEKFYSKSFSDKEEGLKQLQQELRGSIESRSDDAVTKVPPSFNKVARAAIFLLHRALRDKVFSVYSCAAETVRLFFAEFVPHRVSSAEVARSVEKLLPELLTKSGDVTPRIHNMAAHTLLSMAECEDVRRLNIIPVHLSRPLTSSVHPRLALSRLEMVEQLILNHGISKDKKSGLTSRTLAEFGSSGLHHPAEAVRKVSERILLQVYKVNPRLVRKQLPPDDDVTRRNLLYRQLFQEFDFMDLQRKENERRSDLDPNFSCETNKSPIGDTIENHSKLGDNSNDYAEKGVKCNAPSPDNLKPENPRILTNKSGKTKLASESLKEQREIFFDDFHGLKKNENSKSRSIKKNEGNKNSNSPRGILKFPTLTVSTCRPLPDRRKVAESKKPERALPKDQTKHRSGSELKNTGSVVKKKEKLSFSSSIPVPVFGSGPKLLNQDKHQRSPDSKNTDSKDDDIRSRLPEKFLKQKVHEPDKLMGDSVETQTQKLDAKVSTQTINFSLAKNSGEEKEEELKGSARLSESMLACLGQVAPDSEELRRPPTSCIFCLSSKEWTTEDSLNDHYLKDCLMLMTCKYCVEVVEISGLTNHLLVECKRRHLFQKCSSCKEAIIKDIYDLHQCIASHIGSEKQRCPFCQTNIGDGDSCWRKHLMGKNICLKNPRQKQYDLFSGMDPIFMSFSQVNGVPQESKLATYMNHQNSSGPINTLSDAINSINLESPSSLSKDSVLLVHHDLPGSNSIRPLVNTNNGESSNLTTPPPLRESPVLNSLISDSIAHPAPAYRYQINQENVGGTTYFYPATTAAGDSSPNAVSGFQGYAGNHSHLGQEESSLISSSASFYVCDNIRSEILEKSALTMIQPDVQLYPDLPETVDNYHELVPLEPLPIGDPLQIGLSSTYKATHIKTGIRYCLRRIHGFRLSSTKCMVLVDMWKRLSHTNIVQLKEVFTTKAFGDNSIIFVYDYHPGSETLWSRHFSSSESTGPAPFSSDPTAPRPYSHTKNTLLRHQHSSMLPENLLWNYIIQITAAVRVIHGAGLACRTLDPSKIIVSSRNRLRLSCTGMTDVLTPDSSVTNPLALIPHYQQEDLTSLGKLVLALACKSLLGVQRENIQTSLDLVGRTYSSDLKNLIVYLLHNQKRRTVTDLMPMIGARFYAQLETIQTYSDEMENELAKEMDNGRLCRLLAKLGAINERPELSLDPSWSETGDRYMLKLFRDYVFHQVTEDGRPWLEMSHIVQCLNKLDSGSPEKICLMSRDEQSVLVVSYEELKHCLEQSFGEVVASANEKPSAL